MIALVRILAAELLFAGGALDAYALAALALPRAPWATRWTGVVAVGGWLATAGFHALASIDAFRSPDALVAVALLTAVIYGSSRRRDIVARSFDRDRRAAARILARARRSPDRALAIAFGVAALPVLLRALVVPPLGWDALSYHALKAALWVRQGGQVALDAPGPWALYDDFWGGHEIFMAWAMLPLHADTLAMLADAVAWVALALAAFALARALGATASLAAAASGFAVASPLVRILAGSGYVEVSLLAMTVSALALAAYAIRRRSPGAVWLAMAAAGVAGGIKFPALPASLLIACALAVATWPSSWAGRARIVAIGTLLFASSLLPWLGRGWRHTGLPFSPLPVRVLGLPLGAAPPELAWYMDRPIPADPRIGELALLRRALFEEKEGPGATTLTAVAVAVLVWPALLRRRPPEALLLAAISAAAWAAYLSPSLAVPRHYFYSSALRYLAVGIALPIIGSAAALRRGNLARAYTLFLVAGSLFHLVGYTGYGVSSDGARAMIMAAAGLAVALAVITFVASRPWAPSLRAVAAALVVAVSLLALGDLRDRFRLRLFEHDYAVHPNHPYWIGAVAALDAAPPTLIAVTSGPFQDADNWLAYPLLGRRLQHEVVYVPVSRDGGIRHFVSEESGSETRLDGDFDRWRRRLDARGITRVMSFRPASLELRWMEEHPEAFRRIAGEPGDWGLFAVATPAVAGGAGARNARHLRHGVRFGACREGEPIDAKHPRPCAADEKKAPGFPRGPFAIRVKKNA